MPNDPVSVALKFGFLALLFLFALFIARSALKDLRRSLAPAPDSTGLHAAPAYAERRNEAWLIAERGGGLRAGERFDLIGDLTVGRSDSSDLKISDRYASNLHARIFSRDGRYFIEDMGSTNGTLINDASLEGEAEMIDGDMVRIGDTEFRFEANAKPL